MHETAGTSEISLAGRPEPRSRAGGDEAVRRSSLGLSVALLVQYAVGLWLNLYVTVPARDAGGGVLAAVGRTLANGPAALAVHAGLGLVLLLGSIVLVVRAVLARAGFFVVTSAISLLAVLGAAGSGAAFVNHGSDGASLVMGLLTAVALLCQLINLFRLSAPDHVSGQPRR
ncbi:MAG TPA: hypothetical protein VIK57_18915 [Streptosporangiaceae bacterium]